jgi:hypothetical protein
MGTRDRKKYINLFAAGSLPCAIGQIAELTVRFGRDTPRGTAAKRLHIVLGKPLFVGKVKPP